MLPVPLLIVVNLHVPVSVCDGQCTLQEVLSPVGHRIVEPVSKPVHIRNADVCTYGDIPSHLDPPQLITNEEAKVPLMILFLQFSA